MKFKKILCNTLKKILIDLSYLLINFLDTCNVVYTFVNVINFVISQSYFFSIINIKSIIFKLNNICLKSFILNLNLDFQSIKF